MALTVWTIGLGAGIGYVAREQGYTFSRPGADKVVPVYEWTVWPVDESGRMDPMRLLAPVFHGEFRNGEFRRDFRPVLPHAVGRRDAYHDGAGEARERRQDPQAAEGGSRTHLNRP